MKKRSVFWFIIQLLPFFVMVFWAISEIGKTSTGIFLDGFISPVRSFFEKFNFAPVSVPLGEVLSAFGVSTPPAGLYMVLVLVSYEVFTLLIRICYEVIAFLPKFCISVFERKKGD